MSSESPEQLRLAEDANRAQNWKRWGPYLAERQWGTVREDYSANGDAWNYLSHEHARSRAYRWGEDGLLGICDRECRLCFALALWNGRDPILKERLFGLTNPQGNHGEDVKEWYWYLDSTPTHSYMRALYKYPQAAFPYGRLVEENGRRSRLQPEFELSDTGAFDGGRYFDVVAEYAKAAPQDLLIRLTITNRGPEAALLHVLPTLWFRNTWSWTGATEGRPRLEQISASMLKATHPTLGEFRFQAKKADDCEPELIFTENETNGARLFGAPNPGRYVKDAFHDFVIQGRREAVNPGNFGTKAAAHYQLNLPAGGEVTLRLRLSVEGEPLVFDRATFEQVFASRRAEADDFFADRCASHITADQRMVIRQAYAGLLWTKQFYHYVIKQWRRGDPAVPPPPVGHKESRNADWKHLYNSDVISMPDKWEYPWYAAWDLAFHMIPMSRIDPDFAKQQLLLFLREWYMHPNGQIPAYEWNFSDVNPPVHAWACWRVYKISGRLLGRDVQFLERCFQKLLLNFTWWVNRKDFTGKHLFSGGFLGLDNIGLFDRSQPMPDGTILEQADGTAWMGFYCGTMLSMAIELARYNKAYEDVASKFFEHFVEIVDAMNTLGGHGLWNEEDGFYYDQLYVNDHAQPLRVRSLVGIIPLLAVEVLEQETIKSLPGFRKRMRWFLDNRQDLARHVSYMERTERDGGEIRLLAIPSRDRLLRVLRYVLDEKEFLSPFGLRSLSRAYAKPFVAHFGGRDYSIAYEPAESCGPLFGGNSNWRGPVWMPINYLLIEALERYHHFYGETVKVECPTGSGNLMNLKQVAVELAARLSRPFLPDEAGRRPCYGDDPRFLNDPHWGGLVQFHEYFNGDTGLGLGASHQTGWTALVTRCINMVAQVQQD
ncbi:MAG: hypothetical protein QOE70_3723 [Chthoniobacter sp.]|jgi:hypothetical protein|nr:hypothetical protein [Chthoniobacter sp.]